MNVNLRKIEGNWTLGYALDKHTLSSTFLGYNEYGRGQWDTTRSEAGQALFRLKYRDDYSQIEAIAQAIVNEIVAPYFPKIGFVVPMPASKKRDVQPVTKLAKRVAELLGVVCIESSLLKAATDVSLKDLTTKEEKVAVINGAFSVVDRIKNEGQWDALLIDDLFDTGATMEAACHALGSYNKVKGIYVATISWK
ncbi:TPA: ComF family protein [Klebsiella oxytoca]|uniref:ComF family protein n=1 Tax=Klebsiella oxytoca TaxID=571 RepID=UPI00254E2985|nr:ComF family protein [Klebsiella oxytoca]HDM8434767.1 ComF family protein [Yersinia enterocolitica]MDK6513435.1 ComF family protein [Klebsiella oxytoca]MDK8029529.1 ComF family protein [Klebsiella oxytoca]HBM3221022.1 ComF family protein [Klebsiella oxytoca]HBV8970704.1 ComF family protein [Klebsiella oxytoca]